VTEDESLERRPAPAGPRARSGGSDPRSDDVLRDEQTLLSGLIQRLRTLTSTTSVAAWSPDGQGRPVVVAASFDGAPPEAPDPDAWAAACALTQPLWLGEAEAPDALVRLFPHREATALAPIRDSGGHALAVLVVTAASDRVRPRTLATLDAAARRVAPGLAAARALQRLDRLDDRLRRLDRLASLGTLAAEIAHEVRNPLVSVKTFLQLLPQRLQDPEFVTEFLSVATDELGRVERLLDVLIRAPHADDVGESRCDVRESLDALAELLRHPAQARGISVQVEWQGDVPAAAISRDALRQALLNVAKNAIEASPDLGRVRLAARAVEDRIELRVTDEGPGIPVEDRRRIFEPFVTTRPGGGGLGLAITRRLVEESGGSISVESGPERGAVFRVLLPVAD
jgi:signal transduction histidine kinase